MNSGRTKRKVTAIIAIVALVVTSLGATYAYTDYQQHKSNELTGLAMKYEARLVEDFEEIDDWTVADGAVTKKISIANVGKASDGFGDVYVRMQLKEYMEIAPITYVTTNVRYMIDELGKFRVYQTQAAAQAAYPNHLYANLTDAVTGDSGWFVQTQDKDPNGQMGKHVVTSYTVGQGQKIIGGASGPNRAQTTSHHLHPSDECKYKVHTWNGNELESREYIEWILNDPDIIMFSAWDGLPVAKWILDDTVQFGADGWVYWGEALAPETSTALFMEAVELIKQPDGSFYYVIHTDMEAVSLDEILNGLPWGPVGPHIIANAPSATWNGTPPTSVKVGETVNSPGVTVGPAGAAQTPITWTSSRPANATVDSNGVVTGVAEGGPVTITARAPNGATARYTLMVTPGDPVVVQPISFDITEASHTIEVNQTFTPAYVLLPATCTFTPTWQSSNTAIATVNPTTGLITGVAQGTAIITGTVGSGSDVKSDTITINVTPQTITPTGVSIDGADPRSVEVNKTITVTCTLVPPYSTSVPTWASSNTGVATVTVSSDGKTATVRGVTVGSITLGVTAAPGVTDSITVNVVPEDIPATSISINGGNRTMDIGDTISLTYTVVPSNTTDTISWSSSNPGVATVSSTGVVNAISDGTTIITVTAGSVSGTITVTVNPGTDLPLKAPNDGDAYKPIRNVGNPTDGDGYYCKAWLPDPTDPNNNELYHVGSIHLEDIIADGNYSGVTATATSSKYVSFITIGTDHHGKPSIMFSYLPSNQEMKDWKASYPGIDPCFPVELTLSRNDGKSAVIKINMYYWDSLIATM